MGNEEECEFLKKAIELDVKGKDNFKRHLLAIYYNENIDLNNLEEEEYNIWKEKIKNKIAACNSGKYYNSGEGSFSRKKNV